MRRVLALLLVACGGRAVDAALDAPSSAAEPPPQVGEGPRPYTVATRAAAGDSRGTFRDAAGAAVSCAPDGAVVGAGAPCHEQVTPYTLTTCCPIEAGTNMFCCSTPRDAGEEG